jgi:hypothetical protein
MADLNVDVAGKLGTIRTAHENFLKTKQPRLYGILSETEELAQGMLRHGVVSPDKVVKFHSKVDEYLTWSERFANSRQTSSTDDAEIRAIAGKVKAARVLLNADARLKDRTTVEKTRDEVIGGLGMLKRRNSGVVAAMKPEFKALEEAAAKITAQNGSLNPTGVTEFTAAYGKAMTRIPDIIKNLPAEKPDQKLTDWQQQVLQVEDKLKEIKKGLDDRLKAAVKPTAALELPGDLPRFAVADVAQHAQPNVPFSIRSTNREV